MKDKHNKFWNNFSPAIFWGIIVLILSGIPGNAFPKIPTFIEWLGPDKIVHLIIYSIFGYLLYSGFVKQFISKKTRYKIILLTIFSGAVFGALTEVLQYFVFVGRNGNIFDLVANIFGCLIGILIFSLIFSKKIKQKQ